MRLKLIISILIVLVLLYLINTFIGFIPISETCCTGENCIEENQCNLRYPQIPTQTTLNLTLEIFFIALLIFYIYLHLKEKKKNK